MKILAINAGSSTLKVKIFEMPSETTLASLTIDPVTGRHNCVTFKQNGHTTKDYLDYLDSYSEAVEYALMTFKTQGVINDFNEIKGVGHRVVAGGETFHHSVIITPTVLAKIEDLAEFAPLHNPVNAKGIRAAQQLLPQATQVAVFDTAFHSTIPAENYLYGLPYEYYAKYGVRKYGAHGTSHRYVATQAAAKLDRPLDKLKLITLHLGAGASITAIKNGKSLDTSMGFTPVSGVMMATRSGDVDPSALFYLMHKGVIADTDDCLNVLNKHSGMLGVSQLSNDLRVLEDQADDDPQVQLTIDMFVNRVVKYVAEYWVELNGADALIFTGGIGENDALMCQRILKRLSSLGIRGLTKAKVASDGSQNLTGRHSTAAVFMIPTNEELMIARDVIALKATKKIPQLAD